jgi:Domain of unknown function (DUF4279)
VPVSEWTLTEGWSEKDNTEESTDRLLRIVHPHKRKFIEHIREYSLSVTLVCMVKIYEDRPELCLSASSIKMLAELDGELGFDIYDYS